MSMNQKKNAVLYRQKNKERKKDALNTRWLFSMFSNSKISLNQGPLTIFFFHGTCQRNGTHDPGADPGFRETGFRKKKTPGEGGSVKGGPGV